MTLLRWIIILLALLQAGWMAFDGSRALLSLWYLPLGTALGLLQLILLLILRSTR